MRNAGLEEAQAGIKISGIFSGKIRVKIAPTLIETTFKIK